MIFVDSNIILDIVTQDPTWYKWSAHYLENLAEKHRFAINAIVYSEVSIDFTKIEDLEAVLPSEYFEYVPISWEVAFLAGKCFLEYRRNKGTKTLPLPDFFYWRSCCNTQHSFDNSRYETIQNLLSYCGTNLSLILASFKIRLKARQNGTILI